MLAFSALASLMMGLGLTGEVGIPVDRAVEFTGCVGLTKMPVPVPVPRRDVTLPEIRREVGTVTIGVPPVERTELIEDWEG